jgi:DedD protein
MARRNLSEGGAIDPTLSQKKRARRRLIGAAVVALAAAITLPLVLDSEPRQSLPDVEVRIPPRSTPVEVPSVETKAPAVSPVVVDAPERRPAAEPPPSRGVAPAPAAPVADPKPAATAPKPSTAAQPPAASKPAAPVQPVPAPAPAARESAQTPAPAATRFVVQLGAFSSAESAKALAERARKTGVTPYVETINTSAGPRTRVRVGPFPDREAADRVRAQLQLAGVESSVIVLKP